MKKTSPLLTSDTSSVSEPVVALEYVSVESAALIFATVPLKYTTEPDDEPSNVSPLVCDIESVPEVV